MELVEIAPGLRRWTAFHPEWKEEVGCLWYEAPDAVVLVDPLVSSESDREMLDRELRQAGRPLHVLVTVYWHTRSAGELVGRLGGRLWATSRARAAVERRAHAVAGVFRPGDVLPGGVEAHPSGRGSEAVFWLPLQRALVTGDVVLGDGAGGLRLCPASWVGGGQVLDRVRAALRPLLELPVELVLVSHGEPVLVDARDALEHALRQAPSAA
jgi:glyoxylase-like metal-dependent hydrolase (beta-lactamase superfamily II)